MFHQRSVKEPPFRAPILHAPAACEKAIAAYEGKADRRRWAHPYGPARPIILTKE
jgi:hypothetical protein